MAPVLWNVTQIAVTVTVGMKRSGYDLALWVAAGAVLGSLLQFSIQLPSALRLVRGLRPTVDFGHGAVKEVFSNLGPVLVGRGIVQLSAYVDSMLASWLPVGAVAALAYAQLLYTLPISLFGMAVSAAELPEMSSELGETSLVGQRLCARIDVASSRILFFIVPTSVGFLALGDVISGLLFQTGRFSAQDTRYVWWILGRVYRGLGCRNPRTPVLLDLLCFTRHANAPAVCRDSPIIDRVTRLARRSSAAAMVRHSREVRCRGADTIGGTCGMGRVFLPKACPATSNRDEPYRRSTATGALGCGSRRRRTRFPYAATARSRNRRRTGRPWVRYASALRRNLPGSHLANGKPHRTIVCRSFRSPLHDPIRSGYSGRKRNDDGNPNHAVSSSNCG